MKHPTFLLSFICTFIVLSHLRAEDWPSWGKDQSRNMVSSEEGITFEFKPGELRDDESVDLDTTQNVKWVAKLGSQAYGNVTIGEGKVLVGTNNESMRDPKRKETGGLSCALTRSTDPLPGNWSSQS